MTDDETKNGAPGTTDQMPRWEGPEESRPRGYLPAEEDPDVDQDSVGETLKHPRKRDLSDAMKTKADDAKADDGSGPGKP